MPLVPPAEQEPLPYAGPAHIFGASSDQMLSWVSHLATEMQLRPAPEVESGDGLLAAALLDALVALTDPASTRRGRRGLSRTCVSGIGWMVDGRALRVETFASTRGRAFDQVLRSCCAFLRLHLGTMREVIFQSSSECPQDRVQPLADHLRRDLGTGEWEASGVATLSLVLLSISTSNDLIALSDEQVIEAIINGCIDSAYGEGPR